MKKRATFLRRNFFLRISTTLAQEGGDEDHHSIQFIPYPYRICIHNSCPYVEKLTRMPPDNVLPVLSVNNAFHLQSWAVFCVGKRHPPKKVPKAAAVRTSKKFEIFDYLFPLRNNLSLSAKHNSTLNKSRHHV